MKQNKATEALVEMVIPDIAAVRAVLPSPASLTLQTQYGAMRVRVQNRHASDQKRLKGKADVCSTFSRNH